MVSYYYRRGIKTEEKGKVVAAVFFFLWGAESINFFGPLSILRQNDLKKKINSTRTIKRKRRIAPGRYEE